MSIEVRGVVGGKSVGEDIRALEQGVQVVSGTPGRVFDMISRRTLRTRNIKMLVLDEADEMLNQGFKVIIFNRKTFKTKTCEKNRNKFTTFIDICHHQHKWYW